MPPVDNQQLVPMATPAQGTPGSISLATLIEYIIQRTYHELTILSELLPRKTDMDRKIEIVQFASRTRQLFIRLLALVKWANSASKVDKCGEISSFLDSQAMFFVDTADNLAKMARETLVAARLPNFALPCAIDVLTTGTYPRMPTCIKDKIVPPDPISLADKRQTLIKLNQIIEHRLVTSDLPHHMRRLTIENGRVKFFVEHEFKVNYIHQLIQSRLLDNEKPLQDLYNCLHSFCQSLQLEVLNSQTQRLVHERLGEHVRVEDYTAGKCLVLSYWRDPSRRDGGHSHQTVHKIRIHVDDNDPCKPLQISHSPQIQGSESIKVAMAIRSDHLSIEKLLMQTIQVRSTAKLKDLERELRLIIKGPCEIKDIPPMLYIPVLYPCMDSEMLCLAVDIQKGTFLASIQQQDSTLMEDIEECLNAEKKGLQTLLSELRLELGLKRCEKSVQHVPATCTNKLPVLNSSGHPIEKLARHKLFIKMNKHNNYYVVVEAFDTPSNVVEYNYYLLQVTPSGFEPATGESLDDVPNAYLKAGHMIQLDTFTTTHGPCAKLLDLEDQDQNPLNRKRKLLMGDPHEPVSKKQKGSAYFVPELTHILAACDDRIPFIALGEELYKQKIPHQGITVDGDGTCIALPILDLPDLERGDKVGAAKLRADMLSCKFRIQKKPQRTWFTELIFTNFPLVTSNPREHGAVHRVHFAYEYSGNEPMDKIVQSLMEDWNSLCHMYGAVLKFAEIYNDPRNGLQSVIEIKTFTYKRLTLAYGPNRSYTATIQWKNNPGEFTLALGTCGQATSANCHMLVATHLQRQLNLTKSIAQLAQVLSETSAPLTSICKLNQAPVTGLHSRPYQPTPSFTVLPQSTTHIRVIFRSMYCVDLHCRGSKLVGVRDGAYSMFDTSKVVEGLTPTPGLKAFLNMFVDETATASHIRRRSTTEDDNPPSPVGIDPMDSFMSQSHSSGSPASQRQKGDGMRFPMTPPSNPLTPASPSTRMQGPRAPSPAGSFPLASPPSLQPAVTPSPSANLMSPSPLLGGGSPGSTLHVPSPGSFVPAPSPSSLGIHMPSPATQFISPQGMVEGGGSPFPSSNLAMPSPGARNWPGSPSMPGPSPVSRHGIAHSPGHPALHSPQTHGTVTSPPSRMLPQRSWAASIPTLLSHDALNKLLTPCPLPGTPSGTPVTPCCPLERFLSSVYLRRHMQRVVSSDENLQQVPSTEPGVTMFKVEYFQFRVSLNPTTLQSLHLKAAPTPEYKDQWNLEELQILDKFFDIKVVSAPYKANTLTAFGRLLGAPLRVLKDCIQFMKLELVPDRSLKWSLQWCLTLPPGGPPIAPPGTPAVVVNKSGKMVFVLQLTRLGVPVPQGGDPQTVIIPVLHDVNTNTTTMAEQKSPNQPAPSQSSMAINNMFKRFTDFHPKLQECSLYPAIKELLTNLVIPL